MKDQNKTKDELIDEVEGLRTFFLVVDQSPASTIILDKELIVQYVNPACIKTTGYSADEFIGKHIDILRSDLHAPEYYKTIWPTVRSGKVWRGDVCSKRKNGENVWELISISPLKLPTGEITRFLSVRVDDTERKQAEEALLRSEVKYRTLFESSSDAIMLLDDMGFFECNEETLKMFGCKSYDEFLNKHPAEYSPPTQPGGENSLSLANERIAAAFKDGKSHCEWVHKRLDGTEFPADVTLTRTDLDGRMVIQATVRDITERKKAEEKIRYMAFHDPLTGLANRALLIDHLDQAIAMAQRRNKFVAVHFLDIDRFKLINDTLGHTKGDEVLKAVAARLKRHTRKSDIMARQGGDEFIMVAQGLSRVEDIPKVTEHFFSAFKEPFRVDGETFSFTVSIGISIYPNDGEDADTLIKNADIALYEVKDEDKNNYKFFNTGMNKNLIERLAFENKLRKALKEEEFLIHYQPQVDINSREVVGIEALVRWQSPGEGLVPLKDFIPLAEDTGLIVPIGEWVLREACAQNKLWQDSGLKPMPIAVNISMRQFRQKDFVAMVDRVLKETGLNTKYLELELTESVAVYDMQSTLEILGELKALGIRLSIDDFGTGYSSLEYLKLMPLNMLKIAQCFVDGLSSDSSDFAIARATIQLAKSLKFEVIAEGVETREQLALLSDLECEKIQGHLFSKAVPGSDIEVFLSKKWSFDLEQAEKKN
ncbi:MAG: EAL domain-containing protein [Thermodesulfobacteriota bacterium]